MDPFLETHWKNRNLDESMERRDLDSLHIWRRMQPCAISQHPIALKRLDICSFFNIPGKFYLSRMVGEDGKQEECVVEQVLQLRQPLTFKANQASESRNKFRPTAFFFTLCKGTCIFSGTRAAKQEFHSSSPFAS